MKSTLTKMLLASLIVATGMAQAAEQATPAATPSVSSMVQDRVSHALNAVKTANPNLFSNFWFYTKLAAITVIAYKLWDNYESGSVKDKFNKETQRLKKERAAIIAKQAGVMTREGQKALDKREAKWKADREQLKKDIQAFDKTRLVCQAKERGKSTFAYFWEPIKTAARGIATFITPRNYTDLDTVLPDIESQPGNPAFEKRDPTFEKRARVVRQNGELVNE